MALSINAYCPYCEKTVAAMTLLGRDELIDALASDGDVEVMHLAGSDHRWRLNRAEKDHIRKTISEGLL